MSVDPATAKHRVDQGGHAYYFCSNRCREKFIADPNKYLQKADGDPRSVPQQAASIESGRGETSWTCPMHPEIVRKESGSCPICGMALEPMTPASSAEEDNPELAGMTLRLWIGVALSLPLLALSMGGHSANQWLMDILPMRAST
ncbi:MAG: heavy metal-binding domain-containing protein, partial [Acidimicrobiales bacterium]